MATSDSPLSVPNITLAVARAAGGTPPGDGNGNPIDLDLPAANLMVDTFETANMTPTLNNSGFSWWNNNRTSIVTMDPVEGPVAVWNNGTIFNDDPDKTKDWTAKEGSHCLRFRYDIGQGNAEQRFTVGGEHPDLWNRFWLRVPRNYYHGTGNHKFLAISMGEYSSNNPSHTKVIWEYRPNGQPGSSSIDFSFDYYDANFNGGSMRNSGGRQSAPFMSPADQGRWMEVVLHAKASTSGRSLDGVIEMWRRWEDEPSFTKLHEMLDAQLELKAGEPQGFTMGFLMGWANGGFAEITEFLMDKVEFSTEPLL